MTVRCSLVSRLLSRAVVIILTGASLLMLAAPVEAGGIGIRGGAVGGVLVDAQGVLSNPEVEELGRLRQLRLEVMQALPGELKNPSQLRMVSLRGLEQAVSQRQASVQTPLLTDEMHYLAGLTRIQYVLVFPEFNDIVLAGPAEPWTISERGHVVGAVSGQPLLQLDHLLVALRTAESASSQVISCSIDPTAEGIRRFQAFMKTQRQVGPGTRAGIEQALGMQTITLRGVPDTSDFARTLVAADYRMKRLAMGFDRSPLPGMPSYLQMVSAGSAAASMPRWWLAPNYDALLKDAEGLTWELRGPGVKVMTEDSLFAADGQRQQTGTANAVAQRWADTMTTNYEQLSAHEPIFGDLRNVMDMAVVAALIVKENLTQKAGFEMPLLLDESRVTHDAFAAPRQVASMANAVKKGRTWVISASGGVEINSWAVADRTQVSETVGGVRKQASPLAGGHWWWD